MRITQTDVQEEHSPVLTPGAGKNKVFTCGLVEVPLVVGGVKAGPREFPDMVLRIRSGCPLAFLGVPVRSHDTFEQHSTKQTAAIWHP